MRISLLQKIIKPRQPTSCHMRGFTLIETVVAVAILIAAIVGPVTLIAHSLFSASFSRNDLIGTNLAQEGIELFRAVRDNNILCASLGGTMNWRKDPSGGGPLIGYYEIDPVSTTALSCGSGSINTPMPSARTFLTCNMPIKIDANGLYSYVSGTPSGMTRCVRVCSPPNAAPCSAAANGDIPASDQMEIISTVSWSERGTAKSVTLRTRLYNWK